MHLIRRIEEGSRKISRVLEQSNRGEYFPKIRFRGPPIRFATKITTRTRPFLKAQTHCVVSFVENTFKIVFSENTRPDEIVLHSGWWGRCSAARSSFRGVLLVELCVNQRLNLVCVCVCV